MDAQTAPCRPRNAAATRAALLHAARRRFVEFGYDGASLRDVANDVGVDAALVARYFGSKDDLFTEALNACDDDSWMEGGADGLGQRLADALMRDGCDDIDGLLIMLRSVASPRAREIMARWCEESFFGPLTEALGGDDADIRARLTGSMLLGVTVSRALFCRGEMSPAERERFAQRLAAVLQACAGA